MNIKRKFNFFRHFFTSIATQEVDINVFKRAQCVRITIYYSSNEHDLSTLYRISFVDYVARKNIYNDKDKK